MQSLCALKSPKRSKYIKGMDSVQWESAVVKGIDRGGGLFYGDFIKRRPKPAELYLLSLNQNDVNHEGPSITKIPELVVFFCPEDTALQRAGGDPPCIWRMH